MAAGATPFYVPVDGGEHRAREAKYTVQYCKMGRTVLCRAL